MKRSIIISAAACMALCAAGATPWTYADCVDYARSHNITLQKSRLDERTAACNLEEARAQWQPTLDFATTHGLSNYPWADGNKNSYTSSYGLNAAWTVWDGGKRENTIRQQKLRADIVRLNTGSAMRSLETDLLQVFINILYTHESLGIYEEAARVSQAQAERARLLMEAGRMSRPDYVRLQSQYEQDKYALANARATYDTRRMELKQLLELGIDTDITPAAAEWTAAQVLAELPPIDESYRLAMATDLQLRGSELESESAGLDIAIARSGRLPKIALTAGVGTGYFAPGNSFGTAMKQGWNESLGLTLSIPILDGKKTKTAIARARVAELDAQLDIDKRRTELAQLVESSYIDTRSAQSRYKAAESQLQSALLTDELTNEQFNLGYVNTVELMTAHSSLVEARHTLLQAKYMAMLGHKMIEFYRTATVEMP